MFEDLEYFVKQTNPNKEIISHLRNTFDPESVRKGYFKLARKGDFAELRLGINTTGIKPKIKNKKFIKAIQEGYNKNGYYSEKNNIGIETTKIKPDFSKKTLERYIENNYCSESNKTLNSVAELIEGIIDKSNKGDMLSMLNTIRKKYANKGEMGKSLRLRRKIKRLENK